MMQVIHVSEFADEMEMDKWYCSMIWCPSQCYMHVKDDDEISYILYLRWRWDNPWQAHIVKSAHNEASMDSAKWSTDLFRQENLFFTDEQTEEAKTALLSIWKSEIIISWEES